MKLAATLIYLALGASLCLATFAGYHIWKYEQDRPKSCAFADCPQWLQEQIVKENNGLYPPDYYEKDSKMWWRSYCAYTKGQEMPKKFKCK